MGPNQRLIKTGEAINQVFANCIKRLADNDAPGMKVILDMLSGDRLLALVRLREVSLGDEFELELACPNMVPHVWDAHNYLTVNLDDLEVMPYPEEGEFDFTLPGSGKAARFGYLDGHKKKRLTAVKRPLLTAAMMIRILGLDAQRRLQPPRLPVESRRCRRYIAVVDHRRIT